MLYGESRQQNKWRDLVCRLLSEDLKGSGKKVFTHMLFDPLAPGLHQSPYIGVPGGEPIADPAEEKLRRTLARKGLHLVPSSVLNQPRELEVIFVEDEAKPGRSPKLPDGLDLPAGHMLLSCYPDDGGAPHHMMERLTMLTAWNVDYLKALGEWKPETDWNSRYRIPKILLLPRMGDPDMILARLQSTSVMPGVYVLVMKPYRFFLILTQEVVDIPENRVWQLLSMDPQRVALAAPAWCCNNQARHKLLAELLQFYEQHGFNTGVL